MNSSSAPVAFAVIGMGQRLRHVAKNLAARPGVRFAGFYDPDDRMANEALQVLGGRRYESVEALLDDAEVPWVFVGSPNAFHRAHVEAAFARGKHVFCEKPIAISREDALAMHRSHGKSGRLFATGFVLRYATIYRRVKEILASGELGSVVSVDANENIAPDHGAYIMTNWRRHRRLAGSHILEKCVHDLDLLDWFLESVPVRVAAFGGNRMWIPENRELLPEATWDSWLKAPGKFNDATDPFTSDKDIEDHVVSILEYGNGVRVQFQATMSNAIPERRMYFSCVKGTLVVELYAGTIRWKKVGDSAPREESISGGGHGDGDEVMAREMAETMTLGTPPKASGSEGLRSAVAGIAIDEARIKGEVIDLATVWKELGVRT